LRWSIRSGMWEAGKRDCEGKQCCCCPHFPRPSSRRETPPPKKAECLLGLPSFLEGEKAQHKKGGRRQGHPPPPTHNFVMHSSPHLPNKVSSLLLIVMSLQIASGQLSGSECSEDILLMTNVLSLFASPGIPRAQISLLSFAFNSVPTPMHRNALRPQNSSKKVIKPLRPRRRRWPKVSL